MWRNYRPAHLVNPDYARRRSGAVRTDVAYRRSQEYVDTDSIEFFRNVCKNGGICGRRAFFGRFVLRSFGLPSWGVTRKAQAAVGRWTPPGRVVNLGANRQHRRYEGRTGLDFLSETPARKHPLEYMKVRRAMRVGDALGEPKFQRLKPVSGGCWNERVRMRKQAILAAAKPVEPDAVGQDSAAAGESHANRAQAIGKAPVTEADKRISIAEAFRKGSTSSPSTTRRNFNARPTNTVKPSTSSSLTPAANGNAPIPWKSCRRRGRTC